jgi:hypothetical protein
MVDPFFKSLQIYKLVHKNGRRCKRMIYLYQKFIQKEAGIPSFKCG